MTALSRRRMLAVGGGAACALGLAPRLFAHEISGVGTWRERAPMPFVVQEVYPASFWRSIEDATSLKRRPHDIIVNAGGMTPDDRYNVTDRMTWYDPVANQWAKGEALPAPRHHLMLVANNSYLYGLGGFAANENGRWRMRSDCWRIDNVNGEWERRRALPDPQAEAACCSVGGYIHVAGGRAPAGSRNRSWSDHMDTDAHWVYDASADQWFDLAPLPTARNSSAGVSLNGALYVVGGRTVRGGNNADLEVYDPQSDRWARLRPMPQAQGGLAAAVLGGKIYVFGGEYFDSNGGGVYAEAWEYDPKTDQWRAVAKMPRPRHGLGAVTLDNAIYVIGGAAKPSGGETSNAVDAFSMMANSNQP